MLTAADTLAPKGDIERSYFPDDSQNQLEVRMDAWLNEGYSRAAAVTDEEIKDEAARHFAYHKAYMAVYRRLSSLPSSFSAADAGSHGYTNEQIRAFLLLAQNELGYFEVLIPVVTVGGNASALPPTLATRSRVSFF